jgi:glycerol kinase
MAYVLSIDQGTSSSRCIIFDKQSQQVAAHQLEHKQYFPAQGQVEHDPEEIWSNVRTCINEVMQKAQLKASDINSVGITNQRETTIAWNRKTGKPYYNAIVWNDTRTVPICNAIANGNIDLLRACTGLPIAPYFSASKLIWLFENVPGLREDAESGAAAVGTVDSYLIFKLTNGSVHKTDLTNASRTLCMNIDSLQWDNYCLDKLGIPKRCLAEIAPFTSGEFGHVSAPECACIDGVLIGGVLGDQQAALFGQTCFDPGEAKNTYGTGAFLLMNTGTQAKQSRTGLLTTVAYKNGKNSPAVYALEGSVAYCGSLIQWLRDNLQIISSIPESEELARAVDDSGGMYFVPAFAGLHAPYWDSTARGCMVGMTAFNTKAHVARAALEAPAFQTEEVLRAMRTDSNIELKSLKVDGGMTKNELVMQFQSDLLNVPLYCPTNAETTALGAAFAAGLAGGLWKDEEELKTTWAVAKTFSPSMSAEKRRSLLKQWQKAVQRSRAWDVDTDSDSLFSSVVAGFSQPFKILGFGVLFGMVLHRSFLAKS